MARLTSRPSALLNFPAKLCTGNRPPCSRLSAIIRAALSAAAPASVWIASPPEARKTMRAESVPNAQPPVDARTAREPAVAASWTDAASSPAATTSPRLPTDSEFIIRSTHHHISSYACSLGLHTDSMPFIRSSGACSSGNFQAKMESSDHGL